MEQPTTDGFAHEIKFWEGFVKSDRFLNNWVFPEANPEIQNNHPDTAKVFDDFHSEWSKKRRIKVLDIGSGVLSWIKGIIPNMDLTACDPLASKYKKLFDYDLHDQEPPIEAFAEALPFKDGSFDIVHCSNAIDHTQDPVKAIAEMERVCNKDGIIILHGFTNEAIHENWKGLHQWNVAIHSQNESSADADKNLLEISGKTKQHLFFRTDMIAGKTTYVKTGPTVQREWFLYAYKNSKA